ncbi:c-type cytochrome biogenesis protein CcsB [Kocuria rosea]|jgi:cytochrome c-type biogenesis protein CcsB|uniref:c-type cytochrome biogenesis protein CcsB n=1 Tax=Kocuria rosea TaxID=1275 RepID=UPI00203B03E8|nr:c-type cytochrome biogenesis protein CcsB [Kocuria rosea]MCM3688755.1 c-type cytochrome biogenesis protein CcsB [Kocuria rosea]HST72247.1 c-type cytochrome biogenesis protein CcsB [Kocuria rosea]
MPVNETLGTWSELFMLLAAMTYLVSFVAFAWDMASHSKSLRPAGRGGEAELVGAAASGAAGTGAAGAAGSGFRTTGGSRLSGHVADAEMRYTGERRPAARVAVAVMVLAFAVHAAAVVSRAIAAGRVPWGNMYEFCTTGALVVAGVYLLSLLARDLRFVGTLVSGLVVIMLCAATIGFPTPVGPLQPALQSWWLVIHVSIAVAASGVFTITFAMAVLQLLQARREKAILAGETPGMAFLGMVPSSQALENLSFRLNAVGFAFWTFTLAAGAIWAEQAWGRYWGWDTKEVWTFVIWVVYAAYMHARATRGWSGNRSAWLSIVGYLCVIFNFAVVNTVFSGLHSYSGL